MSQFFQNASRGKALIAAPLSLVLTFAPVADVAAQTKNDVFHVNKTFNMQVQHTPFTNPKNTASRTVKVDCGALDVSSSGKLIVTPDFIKPFDLPPLRPINRRAHPAAEGTQMLSHIGKMTPSSHQMCVAQSQIFGGNQQDLEKPYSLKINGREFRTSVPFTDDRYCPPYAALKMCTTTTKDDAKMSDIYKVHPQTGDITLNFDKL